MKIFPQNGLGNAVADVLRDPLTIEREKNEITIWWNISPEKKGPCIGKIFAKYATERKAKAAIEIMLEAYHAYETEQVLEKKIKYSIFRFPEDRELQAWM